MCEIIYISCIILTIFCLFIIINTRIADDIPLEIAKGVNLIISYLWLVISYFDIICIVRIIYIIFNLHNILYSISNTKIKEKIN